MRSEIIYVFNNSQLLVLNVCQTSNLCVPFLDDLLVTISILIRLSPNAFSQIRHVKCFAP